jgi:hypothetical protein
MLAPGRDGNAREVSCVCCARSVEGGMIHTRGGVAVVFFFFSFLLVNKEEGNLPARRTLTHIPSPGLLFFISLTSSSYP